MWPPYLNGDRGWAHVAVAVAAGVQACVRAIRSADPDAEIVHVEAVQAYRTADPSLAGEVRAQEWRSELPTRLILGDAGPDDPLWGWLAGHGISDTTLRRLASEPARLVPAAVFRRRSGRMVDAAVRGGHVVLAEKPG